MGRGEATILPTLNEQTAQYFRRPGIFSWLPVGTMAPIWREAMFAFHATGGKTVCVTYSERKQPELTDCKCVLILHYPGKNPTTQTTHAYPISGTYAEYWNEALPLLELKGYLEKRTIWGPEVGLRIVRSDYYGWSFPSRWGSSAELISSI